MRNKNLKKYLIFIIGTLILLVIFGCTYNTLSQNETSYFSITSTDKNFKNHYFCYDINKKLKTEILSNSDTAQYPLGYTDKKNNILYYVKKDGKCDQIYSYNLKTKTEERLTTDLYAVNNMFVFKDVIYAAAMVKGQRNISLLAINKKNYEIRKISELDLNIESISLKKSDNLIYFVGYNMEEQLDLIEVYEKNNGEELKNATSKLFSYNIVNKKVNLEFESDKMIAQIAVMNKQDKALLKLSEEAFTPFKFYWFDLKSNKITDEFLLNDIVRIDDMAFSNDDNFLYFLGVKKSNSYNQNDVSQTAPSNYIYEYDIRTSVIKDILTLEDKYINNFEIIED